MSTKLDRHSRIEGRKTHFEDTSSQAWLPSVSSELDFLDKYPREQDSDIPVLNEYAQAWEFANANAGHSDHQYILN